LAAVAGCSLDFTRIALDEGAGPYVDVYAFHPYGHPTPEGGAPGFICDPGDGGAFQSKPRPEGINTYEDEIAAFRTLVHKYNPKMEVWADEMNWFAPGEPPMPSLGI